jgi:hypothetical protein
MLYRIFEGNWECDFKNGKGYEEFENVQREGSKLIALKQITIPNPLVQEIAHTSFLSLYA